MPRIELTPTEFQQRVDELRLPTELPAASFSESALHWKRMFKRPPRKLKAELKQLQEWLERFDRSRLDYYSSALAANDGAPGYLRAVASADTSPGREYVDAHMDAARKFVEHQTLRQELHFALQKLARLDEGRWTLNPFARKNRLDMYKDLRTGIESGAGKLREIKSAITESNEVLQFLEETADRPMGRAGHSPAVVTGSQSVDSIQTVSTVSRRRVETQPQVVAVRGQPQQRVRPPNVLPRQQYLTSQAIPENKSHGPKR